MAHGGYREGAGRKPGSKTRDATLVAAKLEDLGFDPITAMVEVFKEARADGELAVAAKILGDLASYVHPKLSSVETKGDLQLTYAQLLGVTKPPEPAA